MKLFEANNICVEELEAYCRNENSSIVIEDGKITGVLHDEVNL